MFITWDPLLPLWDPFWSHFCKLGTTFGALWLHFLSKKTNRGARGATRGAKVSFSQLYLTLGDTIWESFSEDFLFLQEIIMFFHCVFKALFLCSFLCVFEQVGTVKTIKNTAQGSKNSECRKSKKIGPGPGLGWIWESFLGSSWRQMWFFVEKMSARKQAEKRYPRKVKQLQTVMSQGSLTAPLKSKIV